MAEPVRRIEPPADILGWAEVCLKRLEALAVAQGKRADFAPVLMATNGSGLVFEVHGLGPMLSSEAAKNALGETVIPTTLREVEATRFCWATATWTTFGLSEAELADYDAWREVEVEKGNLSVEGAPHVREAVSAVFGDWEGLQVLRMAPIIRVPRRRKGGRRWQLGAWANPYEEVGLDVVSWTNPEMTAMRGRMVDDAMRAVMGDRTSAEVREAILDASRTDEVRHVIAGVVARVASERGLEIEEVLRLIDSNDPEFLKVCADALEEEDGVADTLRAAVEARLGPASPLRSS